MSQKKFLFYSLVVLALLTTMSCATTRFVPANNYVSFVSDEAIKSSEQSMANFFTDYELVSTYEDQFFYNEDGNLIRTIQTEYLEFEGDTPQFIEWDIEYAKIGEKVVPKAISANGIVFVEVEYEIFPIELDGVRHDGIETPRVYLNNIDPWAGSSSQLWIMGPEDFPVGFRVDDQFVVEDEVFSRYTGTSINEVLSFGYGNIALTRLFISYEKLSEGINESFINYNRSSQRMVEELQASEIEFNIDWSVAGEKLVQNRLELVGSVWDSAVHFIAEREFNEAGQRIHETWQIQEPEKVETEGFITIFEQSLSY